MADDAGVKAEASFFDEGMLGHVFYTAAVVILVLVLGKWAAGRTNNGALVSVFG